MQTGKLAAEDQNIEEDINRIELKKAITSCLDALPLIYRSPLALFYLADKSYEEIGDILRMPVGTVGTRISRGKRLLAEICRKEGLATYAKN